MFRTVASSACSTSATPSRHWQQPARVRTSPASGGLRSGQTTTVHAHRRDEHWHRHGRHRDPQRRSRRQGQGRDATPTTSHQRHRPATKTTPSSRSVVTSPWLYAKRRRERSTLPRATTCTAWCRGTAPLTRHQRGRPERHRCRGWHAARIQRPDQRVVQHLPHALPGQPEPDEHVWRRRQLMGHTTCRGRRHRRHRRHRRRGLHGPVARLRRRPTRSSVDQTATPVNLAIGIPAADHDGRDRSRPLRACHADRRLVRHRRKRFDECVRPQGRSHVQYQHRDSDAIAPAPRATCRMARTPSWMDLATAGNQATPPRSRTRTGLRRRAAGSSRSTTAARASCATNRRAQTRSATSTRRRRIPSRALRRNWSDSGGRPRATARSTEVSTR